MTRKAKKQFPILSKYTDNWPIADMLLVYLKNGKSRNATQAANLNVTAIATASASVSFDI